MSALQGLFSGDKPIAPTEPVTQTEVATEVPVAQEILGDELPTISATPAVTDLSPTELSSDSTLGDFITGGKNGQVNEERLQHGIVRFLLNQEDPSLEQGYLKAFQAERNEGVGTEDAVKQALKSLVENGGLTRKKAREINGISFRAAQLDSRLSVLYDGKGGPGDNTVAKMEVSAALSLAEKTLKQIESGALSAPPRALSAPSNTAQAPSNAVSSGSSAQSSQEFLWKPVSDSDGKLVVLLPADLAGQVQSVGVFSTLPPSSRTRLAEGRYTGNTENGNRLHYRFSKSGASFPNGSFLVATLSSGKTVSYKIPHTSARFTKV